MVKVDYVNKEGLDCSINDSVETFLNLLEQHSQEVIEIKKAMIKNIELNIENLLKVLK